MKMYGIKNKELNVILPEPWRYHSPTDAVLAMEEIISYGKNASTRVELREKLKMVTLDGDQEVENNVQNQR